MMANNPSEEVRRWGAVRAKFAACCMTAVPLPDQLQIVADFLEEDTVVHVQLPLVACDRRCEGRVLGQLVQRDPQGKAVSAHDRRADGVRLSKTII